MELTIYDFFTVLLAVGVAIYHDQRHRTPKMTWRIPRFLGLVVGVVLWGYVMMRVLAQP